MNSMNRCNGQQHSWKKGLKGFWTISLTCLLALVLLPAPSFARCAQSCLDEAAFQADLACEQTFQQTGSRQFCEGSFRHFTEVFLLKPKVKCNVGYARFNAQVVTKCNLSPGQILPIVRARCVGEKAFLESLFNCKVP